MSIAEWKRLVVFAQGWNASEKLVALLLSEFVSRDTHQACIGVDRLARYAGLGNVTVRRALENLAERQLIVLSRERHAGFPRTYTLQLPPDAKETNR